jgi:transcriptional regulator with XRE-family HTH domain
METALTIPQLQAAGVSKSYACEILSGKRKPSPALACRIYRALGHRFEPIAHMTDDEIAALERSLALLDARA